MRTLGITLEKLKLESLFELCLAKTQIYKLLNLPNIA